MQASDPISLSRIYLAEPGNGVPGNVGSRWSDANLLTLEYPALRAVARDVEWPEGTVQFSTQVNVQEYTLLPIAKLLRVYVLSGGAPQILQPTSIPLMQGDQIELYDQSSGSNNFQPQWTAQTPESYPVSNSQFGAGNSPIPYFPGQRPQYYLRGANLGLIPAPSAQYTVIVDMIPMPQQPTALTSPLYFPDDFAEAIAWKICEQAWVGDAQRASSDATWPNQAASNYAREVAKLRLWKSDFNPNLSSRPQILTYRTLFPVVSPTTYSNSSGDC